MLIHISENRLNGLKSQGFRFDGFGTLPAVSVEDFLSNPDEHMVEYHTIEADHGFCKHCRTMADSVLVNTPVELETIKAELRAN